MQAVCGALPVRFGNPGHAQGKHPVLRELLGSLAPSTTRLYLLMPLGTGWEARLSWDLYRTARDTRRNCLDRPQRLPNSGPCLPTSDHNCTYHLVLITLLLPIPVRIVALFQIKSSSHWIDTFWVLIVPFLASATYLYGCCSSSLVPWSSMSHPRAAYQVGLICRIRRKAFGRSSNWKAPRPLELILRIYLNALDLQQGDPLYSE